MAIIDQVVQKTEGKLFYNDNLPEALREAQKYAANGGLVLSLPQILHARVVAPAEDEIWQNWITALTEEDVVKTESGKPVVVVGHGGLILGTPERIEQAYKEGLTPQRAAKLSPQEVKDLLSGKSPLLPYKEFLTKTNLPQVYGIVLDLDVAKKTESGYQDIEGIYENPLAIARAGGVEQLKSYLDRAKLVHKTKKYGQWHPFNNIDPEQAQGRLVCAGGGGGGLGGDDLGGSGRFASVAPEALVAKNLADKTRLEAKVQSALDAGSSFEHNGTLYVAVKDPKVSLRQ